MSTKLATAARILLPAIIVSLVSSSVVTPALAKKHHKQPAKVVAIYGDATGAGTAINPNENEKRNPHLKKSWELNFVDPSDNGADGIIAQ